VPFDAVRLRSTRVSPLEAARLLGLGDCLVSVLDQLGTAGEVYHAEPREKPHEKPTPINREGSEVYHGVDF